LEFCIAEILKNSPRLRQDFVTFWAFAKVGFFGVPATWLQLCLRDRSGFDVQALPEFGRKPRMLK